MHTTIRDKTSSLEITRLVLCAKLYQSGFLWTGNIISLLLGQNCQFVDLDFVSTNETVGLYLTKSSTPKSFFGLTRGEGQKPLGTTLPPSNKGII